MAERYKWLHDAVGPDLVTLHSIRDTIYSGHTMFQAVEILRTGSYGLCLVLDGKIQSSEVDEFIYHDGLVQPAMTTHPNPQNVFIAGGGEGATLREVLAQKTVRRAVMVDIDGEVVDLAKRFLPTWHQGAFDDPRTELHIADARKYLEESKEQFDVIVLDLPDPLEGGPAVMLFTREFFETVSRRLAPGGIVSVQAGASTYTNFQTFIAVLSTLRSVFPIVRPCSVYVPSFSDNWGFGVVSHKLDALALTPDEVDRRIAARFSKEPKSYDGLGHINMLTLPKHIRQRIESSKRVVTDKEPVFTY